VETRAHQHGPCKPVTRQLGPSTRVVETGLYWSRIKIRSQNLFMTRQHKTAHLVVDRIRRQTAVAPGFVHSHQVDLAAAHNLALVAVVAAAAGHSQQVAVVAVTEAAAAAVGRSLASVTGLDKHQSADLQQLQVSQTNCFSPHSIADQTS